MVVTHNLAQARRVADRVAFLLDGELVELGRRDDSLRPAARPAHARLRRGPASAERCYAGAPRSSVVSTACDPSPIRRKSARRTLDRRGVAADRLRARGARTARAGPGRRSGSPRPRRRPCRRARRVRRDASRATGRGTSVARSRPDGCREHRLDLVELSAKKGDPNPRQRERARALRLDLRRAQFETKRCLRSRGVLARRAHEQRSRVAHARRRQVRGHHLLDLRLERADRLPLAAELLDLELQREAVRRWCGASSAASSTYSLASSRASSSRASAMRHSGRRSRACARVIRVGDRPASSRRRRLSV